MKKGHPAPVRTGDWCLVDQPEPQLLQPLQMAVEAPDSQADMVNPLTVLVDEPPDRRLGCQRLEQLQMRVSHRQKGSLHTLGLDGFEMIDRETEGLVDRGRLDRFHRNADVIQPRFLHDLHQLFEHAR